MPEVLEFYRMAGDVDYMPRVVWEGHRGLRRILQETDRVGAAQERDVAFRDGENQVDDGTPISLKLRQFAVRWTFGEMRGRMQILSVRGIGFDEETLPKVGVYL